jgi:hypothetical protein
VSIRWMYRVGHDGKPERYYDTCRTCARPMCHGDLSNLCLDCEMAAAGVSYNIRRKHMKKYESTTGRRYHNVTIREMRSELQHNFERGVDSVPLDALLKLVIVLENELTNNRDPHLVRD